MMAIVKAMSVKSLLLILEILTFGLPIRLVSLDNQKMSRLANFHKLEKLLKIKMGIQRKDFSSRVMLFIR